MPAGIYENDTMMSVRQTPWHGLGVVLPEYPKSLDEAIEKSGLGWGVSSGSVFVSPDVVDNDPFERLRIADQIAAQYADGGVEAIQAAQLEEYLASQRTAPTPPRLIHATDYRGNIREDTGDVLGIVTDQYRIVPNRQAFAFLEDLIGEGGGQVLWETAGSLLNGRKVWVLVRIPGNMEIAGDETATYIYVANGHDGSMAVTAAATKIRIVCQNTLGWALRKSESGPAAERTYKFRHTGDLQLKYKEAARVMGLVHKWGEAMKALGDELGRKRMSVPQFRNNVVIKLVPIDRDEMTKRKIANREDQREMLMNIFQGTVPGADTTGNAPGTAWTAANAVGEWADWHGRYASTTDQMNRSFEARLDVKQFGLDLVREAVGV